jgi:phytoene dehydrogenase-like protein
MIKYDDIVVGSGSSGLTMTLLLAMKGHKVLLLEKAPDIGGSLARFSRKGVRFDTGFHFTGGMNKGGILADILSFLGMAEMVEPVFLEESSQNRFVFESSARTFEHPVGLCQVKERFKGYFPAEAVAIDRYFDLVTSVCNRTPSMNIHENLIAPPNLDEDYLSLDTVLQGLTADASLRGLLSGYAMCYGVRPAEISFANHARMVQNFYESIAFVKDGGDGFINAFRQRLSSLDVDIRCRTTIQSFGDIRDGRVNSFLLSDGQEVMANSCVLTIHPREILALLPEKHYSRAFAARVSAFEPSAGFFSVFARIKPGVADPDPEAAIVSLFPDDDVNKLLSPDYHGVPAMVIIKSPDQADPEKGRGVCILEPSFPQEVAGWQASSLGHRPAAYQDYKQARLDAIKEHIFSQMPVYRDSLEFLDAGSLLTYRDYLFNHDGSAYGIKQKMQQFNLIGRLPLHNLYAAGQSALLPGILGAMMSSLIVGRSIIGRDDYGKLLGGGKCS